MEHKVLLPALNNKALRKTLSVASEETLLGRDHSQGLTPPVTDIFEVFNPERLCALSSVFGSSA